MNSKNWVWPIVVLYIALAAAYARVTPYRAEGSLAIQPGVHAKDIGAPDERQHVNYVSHLLEGKGIPVFNPKDPQLYESYQSHQPPLFYLMEAGYARLLGLSDLTGQQAGFLLRFLNALIGGVGILGIWFLAWWGFGSRAHALTAAAIAALLPMNLALGGAVSNDPLLIALCTWCLALCAKGVRDGWNLKLAAATGLTMGLAFLTKTTSVALLPVVALACFLTASNDGRLFQWNKGALRVAGVALGVALLLGLPWWIRNQSLYGDPLAMTAFNQAFVGSPQTSEMMQRAGGPFPYWVKGVGQGTMCSFFGVFGYWDVWMDSLTYYALGVCALILAVGWGFSLRGRRADRPLHLLNGLFLLFIVAAFVRFNLQYFQAQGRYLLPALGPIAVGLGAGLVFLARKKAELAAVAAAALLMALNLYIVRDLLPNEFADRVTPPPPTSNSTAN
jgi:4-amino-4-deoxy-L-arabinose transferase-like glycosyltransferase